MHCDLRGGGDPDGKSAAVYDYYKKSVIVKNFSVAPDDIYEHVLHKRA